MTAIRGLPSGRAGRVWLQRRLAAAEKGAALLDHKLRILRMEHQRLVLIEERTRAEWEQAAREAELWSIRAAVQGGRRAFRLAAPPPDAEARITWSYLMGVRYPSEGELLPAVADPGAPPPAGAALVVAADRHRRALDAACRHAVARRGTREMEAEMLATRRRVRAIEDRWLPRLRAAHDELTVALEEQEHSDAVRLRWSAGRGAGPAAGPAAGPGGGGDHEV